MKRLHIAYILIFLLLVTGIRAQETSEDAEKQKLMTLAAQFEEASQQKDAAALERYLADDFFASSPGYPEKIDKSEWIRQNAGHKASSLEYRHIRVNIYGDTAVVDGMLHGDVKLIGISIGSDFQLTDIWVKRNGQWQMTARYDAETYSLGGWLRVFIGIFIGMLISLTIYTAIRLILRLVKKLRANN